MKNDETVRYMKIKMQLKTDLINCRNKTDKIVIEKQIQILENYLAVKCADRNKDLVTKYFANTTQSLGYFAELYKTHF